MSERGQKPQNATEGCDGVLLLFGGPEADGEEQQAGCWYLLTLRWRGECRRNDDRYEVLLRSLLLEVLAGHHLHILRGYSKILPSKEMRRYSRILNWFLDFSLLTVSLHVPIYLISLVKFLYFYFSLFFGYYTNFVDCNILKCGCYECDFFLVILWEERLNGLRTNGVFFVYCNFVLYDCRARYYGNFMSFFFSP